VFVDDLLEILPEELFQEWFAEFRRDPWDEQRADLRLGIVASIVDAHRVNATTVRPPKNYMPYSREKVQQQPDQGNRTEVFRSFASKWNRR